MKNIMTEYGFSRASDDVVAIRTELADQVVQVLQHAGLTAFRDGAEGSLSQSGAVIYVDTDAETASAPVSVGWRPNAVVSQAAVDALSSGQPHDAPVVRRPGTIGLHMQTALIKILLSAGIIATLENDSMNPDYVLVFGKTCDLPPALRPMFIPLAR
ncbi:hypothetical protein ACIPW5_26140 [Streptomyces sp. NPDC090077]|uniref:hypothetical protein n=1 Tax=Streptomyces sp. NPDC090077 TaxID=3365938 RepID=UPI003805B950